MKIIIPITALCLLSACQGNKSQSLVDTDTVLKAPVEIQQQKIAAQIHTDTLQYIHFEGNFDYWYAVFINAKKDTVQLVVDKQPSAKFRNKLVQVQWFTDTLTEAGDNDAKYAARRLKDIRLINGKPFAAPVTEQTVISDIMNLPEVKANAERAGIAERPTDDREYYLVETGTHEEDKFSRLFMFRVYVYPKYEIKFFDPGTDTEMGLAEWRKSKQ